MNTTSSGGVGEAPGWGLINLHFSLRHRNGEWCLEGVLALLVGTRLREENGNHSAKETPQHMQGRWMLGAITFFFLPPL